MVLEDESIGKKFKKRTVPQDDNDTAAQTSDESGSNVGNNYVNVYNDDTAVMKNFESITNEI
jgi:hypothetical protein